MTTKSYYEAIDGTKFLQEDQCLLYESLLLHTKKSKEENTTSLSSLTPQQLGAATTCMYSNHLTVCPLMQALNLPILKGV